MYTGGIEAILMKRRKKKWDLAATEGGLESAIEEGKRGVGTGGRAINK